MVFWKTCLHDQAAFVKESNWMWGAWVCTWGSRDPESLSAPDSRGGGRPRLLTPRPLGAADEAGLG